MELDLCQTFGVSRTPIRGALKLLAAEGVLSPRAGRGYVLTRIPTALKEDQEPEEEEDQRLFDALSRARGSGKLGESFTQQEILNVINRSKKRQAEAIITTQKDAVRFPKLDRRDLPIFFMRVEIKILAGANDFQDCVRKICFR